MPLQSICNLDEATYNLYAHSDFFKGLAMTAVDLRSNRGLFLASIPFIVAAHESRLIVPIDPRTLSEKERALISKNTVTVDLGAVKK